MQPSFLDGLIEEKIYKTIIPYVGCLVGPQVKCYVSWDKEISQHFYTEMAILVCFVGQMQVGLNGTNRHALSFLEIF